MIQFNLLPDVKVEFLCTQRIKRMVILAAIAASALSIAILVLMFSYSAIQKGHITNLDKDIDGIKNELSSNKELTKILSVQNQLNSLPALYDGRPAAERLPGYLEQTTPSDVGLSKVSVDFSLTTVVLTGTAANLEAVNRHVNMLKSTVYRIDDSQESISAFKDVILASHSRNDKNTSFTINFSFDPQIFDNTKKVNISVTNSFANEPNGAPSELFDGSSEPQNEGQ